MTDRLQDNLANRMTLRPHLVFAAFGSDLESPSENDEDRDLEGLSDAEKNWHEEMEEHFDVEPKEEFEWERGEDYGIDVPEGGLTSFERTDLARLYARSSPIGEAIWYAVNAYHWMEADWLEVLNSDDAFGEFMRMQRKYYEDCLDDSELIGQTAECAGVEKTKAVLAETDSVFGSIAPTDSPA